MAEPVVLDFDGTETADAMLAKRRVLRTEHHIDLPDAVVVTHPEGGGSRIRQSVNLTALGAGQGDDDGCASRRSRRPVRTDAMAGQLGSK